MLRFHISYLTFCVLLFITFCVFDYFDKIHTGKQPWQRVEEEIFTLHNQVQSIGRYVELPPSLNVGYPTYTCTFMQELLFNLLFNEYIFRYFIIKVSNFINFFLINHLLKLSTQLSAYFTVVTYSIPCVGLQQVFTSF